MAEDFGVQGRGGFYDGVGAVRDVVQNHLLQVVALLAMNAPIGRDPQSIHLEKLRLLRAMRPLEAGHLVRGQFRGARKSVEKGTSGSVRVDHGGRRLIKNKQKYNTTSRQK